MGSEKNKIKLFVDNFLIYGLGGIISKIVPLIMVPIVTRLMPSTEYFAISDLSNTIVSFASALAVMGMYDAMYRIFFERDDIVFKKNVCSTTLMFTLITSIIVFVLMLVYKGIIAELFFGNKNYDYVIYISAVATLVSSTNTIVSAPTRMQNKRKIYLVTNTVAPVLTYAVSIPLLLLGYYVSALPLSFAIAGGVIEIIFFLLNKEWFSAKLFDIKILKDLCVIGFPLLPNFLIYWVFNSCDKVMITNILGLGEAGIYSAGSKLGNCSQLIYVAFAGGWQYFALSTMREKKQVESNSLVFEYLGVISYVVTAFVCAWSYSLFGFLFTEQYRPGYIVAPYLFLAPLLQMLFQVIASQFLIIKKTWPNMIILGIGAAFNIILNRVLIPKLGIEGASIATLVGYIVSIEVCIIVLYSMKLIVISARFILSSILMFLYYCIWRLMFNDRVIIGTGAAILFLVIELFVYRKDLLHICNNFFHRRKIDY